MIPQDPVKWAVQAFKDGRNDTYETYHRYLKGDHPLVYASVQYEGTFGRLLEGFNYNRCGMVVDAHADRLQVEGFVGNQDTHGQAAWDIWNRNRMPVSDNHAEVDAFGLGDAYIIVELHPERAKSLMWVQDPRNMRVHYSDDLPWDLDLAAKMWIDDDSKHARLNLYFKDRIEKYISSNRSLTGTPNSATAFEKYQNGDDGDFQLNITDTVPVFHLPNNGRTNTYGNSELVGVVPLQNALNKTLMDMLVGQEFAAWPQKVMIGVDVTDEEVNAGLSRFEAGVKRIWTMEAPDAKIGEFSAVNIAQHLASAEFFDKAISRVTKVPIHYLGMSGDFTSGLSKRIVESPFTAKLEDRQIAGGYGRSEAVSYAMRLEGIDIAADELETIWKSASPLSEEDELEIALRKQDVGFPFETILEEMGRDEDDIAKIMELKNDMVQQAQREFNRGAVVPDIDDEDEVA